MIASQEFIVNGLLTNEDAIGNPVFKWQANDYTFVPSLNTFNRELETGGFNVETLLTLKVRLLDGSGNDVFTSGLPSPQQTLTYKGVMYRIINVHSDPTLSYIRIIATGTTRGI